TLHARSVDHPWLERATEWLWERLESGPGKLGAYELMGACRFLDHVPDRDRAEAAFALLVTPLEGIVTEDPAAEGETHGPLGFAPEPASIARRAFDPATVDAHLDHLAA